MKVYHGSPRKLKILKPQKAKGLNTFENISGIFLTKTFLHAALYSIGKTLKGKTVFGVSENKLVILGNKKPGAGYVYEVNVKSLIKGPRGQWASKESLKPIKITKVFPKNYSKNILIARSRKELIKFLKKT